MPLFPGASLYSPEAMKFRASGRAVNQRLALFLFMGKERGRSHQAASPLAAVSKCKLGMSLTRLSSVSREEFPLGLVPEGPGDSRSHHAWYGEHSVSGFVSSRKQREYRRCHSQKCTIGEVDDGVRRLERRLPHCSCPLRGKCRSPYEEGLSALDIWSAQFCSAFYVSCLCCNLTGFILPWKRTL